ncbi:hypothetical protein K402DRAFT_102762 [Aulographum hederae CBS 113979]|uniref:Uncharacterized protein n=1 Tax=Aulographum hederae CBS 113979 TaxID=1176131 RepID=A0A6G1GY39_9PEZI|nr:hypothetical protein K402DRAFT_102762 [Aulographum hederae CBS 113979]
MRRFFALRRFLFRVFSFVVKHVHFPARRFPRPPSCNPPRSDKILGASWALPLRHLSSLASSPWPSRLTCNHCSANVGSGLGKRVRWFNNGAASAAQLGVVVALCCFEAFAPTSEVWAKHLQTGPYFFYSNRRHSERLSKSISLTIERIDGDKSSLTIPRSSPQPPYLISHHNHN